VAEWSKALAWKVSIRQKRIEGSNPSRSAIQAKFLTVFYPRPLEEVPKKMKARMTTLARNASSFARSAFQI
jgi:hypothetical protein